MEHLNGGVLFLGALLLSGAVATGVWSLTQVALERAAWRAKHGARVLSTTAAKRLSGHWQRAMNATLVAASLVAVPALLDSLHLIIVIAG